MKKLITYLKTLWSWGLDSQSSEVGFDCRLTVGSPSGLDAKWKQNPFMRFAVVLTLIFTIGSGNVWGTEYTYKSFTTSFVKGSTNGTSVSTQVKTDGTTKLSTISNSNDCFTTNPTTVSNTYYNSTGVGLRISKSSGAGSIKFTLTDALKDSTIYAIVVYASKVSGNNKATLVVTPTAPTGGYTTITNIANGTLKAYSGSYGGTNSYYKLDTIKVGGKKINTLQFGSASGGYTHLQVVEIITQTEKAAGCSNNVGVTKGTENHGEITTISSASVATCSSTDSERRVTITVTPDDCYDAPTNLTWTKSSGTVTASKQSGPTDNGDGTYSYVYQFAQNDNGAGTFGVTCTAKAAGKTVNFDAGPGVSASSSLTENCSGSGVTLPTVTATGVCKGWTTFAGWATAPVTDSTTTSVTVYAAGSNYVPASNNMTLYAVYSKVKGGGSSTLTIYPSTYTNKGTNNYGSGAERTGTVGTINLGAHYVTGNAANTPGGSTAGQFLQCQGNNANIYNKTALPGKITQVVLNQNSATAFSLYCGTEQLMASNNTNTGQTPSGTQQTAQSAATQMTWTVSGNYTYFDLKKGSSAGYVSSIVVTYSSSATYYCSDPNCCTPLASINGSINSSTPTSVTLQWDKLSGVRASTPYEVSVSPSAGTSVGGIDLSGAKATCSVTGLTPCTAYTFTINAYGDASHCDNSDNVAHTTAGYTLTVTKTGVTLSSGSEPSNICANVSATYGASTGYSLPSTITVTNAGAQNTGWTWNSGTGVLTINKANVTGNVTVTISGNCVEPAISAGPADADYYQGDSPDALEVTATLASGTLTYLWKVSTNGGSTWSDATGTNNTSSYSGASLSTASAGTLKFKCIVGNSQGGCTVESAVATITVATPSSWKLKGSWDDWTEYTMVEDAGVASYSINLAADSRFEFGFDGGSFYKNNGTIITTTSGWVFNTSDNNCHIHTGPAGTYTFAINTSTKAVTVTYPTVTHPNEHYVYFKNTSVWGTVKGYLGNTGNDNKAAAWPGSDMQATASICGETYHYAALNAMSGTYNVIVFNNGSGSQTSDLSTTGSLGKYNANQDANWHDFHYTITYAAGTGSGSMTPTTGICPGSDQAIATNTFTAPDHYHFNGWTANTSVTVNSASTTSVPAGATIQSVSGNVTLTAQWAPDVYTVSSTLSNCSSSPSIPTSYTYTGSAAGLTYTISANSGYRLPTSVTVTGSTYTWNSATGVLTLTGTITGNVSITVTAVQTHTIDWYVGGTAEGNKLTTGSQTTVVDHGGSITTLPSEPSGAACDKVFVGWTNTTSYTHGTSLLFTDAAGSPAITANTNFYAVFATVSSGGTLTETLTDSEIETNFTSAAVAYGDDEKSYTDGDITWAARFNANAGVPWFQLKSDDAVYLKITAPGAITKLDMNVSNTSCSGSGCSMNMSAHGYSGSNISLNTAADGSGTTVANASPNSQYAFSLSPSGSNSTLYLKVSGATRIWADITVTYTGGTTYSGHTITCTDCGTSVTPTFTAAPAGGTVAVTKGGNAVASGSTVKTCTSQDLSVTITPTTHYTLTGFTATGLTTGTATISPVVAETLPKTTETTFTVTVSAGATGTLNLTPTFTEDTKVAITWNVNGVNQPIAATQGLTWVYSGEDLTALPSTPSVPAGCSGTKVFAGWSQKHSDATEQDAAWYDDLFDAYDDPTVPTGITSAKTFYAVFATSSSNPLAGTVMWDEPFDGDAGDQPSSPTSGATVYGSASISYNCASTTYCKLYTDNLASGGAASPELLIPKSSRGEAFEITGIPTAGQTELTLTYMAKDALSVTTGTSGVTVGDASADGKLYTRTITIDQSGLGVATFGLTFAKSTDSNSRLDDIHLVVPGSGTMTDYVTLCAPSYTITYNKNTSDPVTNLPSPTSVLQSTGSGTLSSTVPERATYTFSGWSETTSGAVAYVAGGSITGVSADKTLYAVWTKTPVEELSLNYSELNKYVGDPAVTLEVTGVTPEGADPSVTWSSSNSGVASVVAATGVVTFGTVGTATITATSTVTGTTTAYCYVTVRNKPTATFTDLIHDGNGTDLSDYNLQDVAGTAIVFPTLSNTTPDDATCDGQHYVFIGWTTSNNNDDPEDHLVASDELEDDQDKVFYAVWADGVAGVSYTKMSNNSFKTSPAKYVIGVESGGDTYYLYDCASTDANNSWGYTTNAPGTNAPIQFTLSGTTSALVATSTEVSARYLTPLTAKNFQMSATSKSVQLDADGTIHNTGDNSGWNLRGNSTDLRWYNGTTGTSAYFYEVTAGSSVSYRTSCCTNNVAAPTVVATNTAYTVTLTWAAVDGATGYEVSWNGGAFEAATSPCVKSGLTASTDYIYKVRATYDPLVKCGALVASGSVTTDDVYTVTYSGGTGTGSCSPSGSVAPASYEVGATVTLAPTNSFSLTSNTFAAWVVKDADDNDVPVSNNQFTMPAKNVTVTATWTAVQDKYYDRMHDGTDALHGGFADGEGKYYLVLEGCNYTVPTLTDDDDGDTDCHTTHYKLLGWIAYSHLKTDGSGQIKPGEESYIFQGGGTKSATGATYYAIWAIMTE